MVFKLYYLKNALVFLRIIALVEGFSFLLLGFTMILKYKYNMLLPNYFVGMSHGVLFVVYILLVGLVSYLHKWNIYQISLSLIASLVPFGTFYVDKKIITPCIKQLNSDELAK